MIEGKVRTQGIMKKHLAKFIFLLAMIVGLSFSVSAQSDDKKKKKPKRPETPEIVVPKKPKRPKEDDRNKKKKPDSEFGFLYVRETSDLS